ncbi:MAG: hypothetical protein E7345_03030 [Clostridiales bacterium]|nr:hypothetical protein [Clostridiales bacterium]
MTVLEYILLSLCLVSMIAFIVTRVIKGGLAGVITKTVASFVFVISGVLTLATTNYDRLIVSFIVIGLIMGMLGDILLDLKVVYPDNDKYYLNSGMASFGIGHIFYFLAFTMIAQNLSISLTLPLILTSIIAVILTISITLSSKTMNLNFGKFLWQTVGYTFILSFMTVYTLMLAIKGMSFIPFIGLLLFFLSDIVLSFQYFGGKIADKKLIVINHALYYLAQITLVFYIMFI